MGEVADSIDVNRPSSRSVSRDSRARAPVEFKYAAILLLALFFPFILTVGGLRLSVYRIVLIIAFLPLLKMWLGGRAGPIRTADILVILFALWASLSFAVVHGPIVGIEAGGIFTIETVGAYLMARCLIRDAETFRKMAKLLTGIILVFLPFAVIEAVTGTNILLKISDSIWTSLPRVDKEPRWGMHRVQATFEHPILYGVVCGSAIALTYMVSNYGKSFFNKVMKTGLVTLAGMFSLSSGPLTAMVAQLLLLAWETLFSAFRARWRLLSGIVLFVYLVLEIASNRSIIAVFIEYFAFNQFSAYLRILIWQYGIASVIEHPFFGIGFNEWSRPNWMANSIDMFWLVPGVLHGAPAMLLMLSAFFAVYLPLAFKKLSDRLQSSCRLGILFCLTGFFLGGWTVHFWNATYVLYMFLLGSGVWLLDAERPNRKPPMQENSDPPVSVTRSSGAAASRRSAETHRYRRHALRTPPRFRTNQDK